MLRNSFQRRGTCCICRHGKLDKADANGIFSAIKSAVSLTCQDTPVETVLSKMVAFAADGASVNAGQYNGVIASLQREISQAIITINCLAHCVELAYKQALKGVKVFDKSVALCLAYLHFITKVPTLEPHLQPKTCQSLK